MFGLRACGKLICSCSFLFAADSSSSSSPSPAVASTMSSSGSTRRAPDCAASSVPSPRSGKKPSKAVCEGDDGSHAGSSSAVTTAQLEFYKALTEFQYRANDSFRAGRETTARLLKRLEAVLADRAAADFVDDAFVSQLVTTIQLVIAIDTGDKAKGIDARNRSSCRQLKDDHSSGP